MGVGAGIKDAGKFDSRPSHNLDSKKNDFRCELDSRRGPAALTICPTSGSSAEKTQTTGDSARQPSK
jgi:hypothetical protein